MRREHHFLPPRSAVVFAHTRRMLDTSAMCLRKFSTALAEHYVERVAPDLRTVPFRWGVTIDDLFKAERHNAQIVGRYMDGTVKVLPADLEDAWLLALPEPYRSECERELAQRRGRVSFLLEDGPGEESGAIGAVLTEAGQLCAEWGKILADGRIDQVELATLLNESHDVIGAVMRLQRHAQERAAREASRG